MIYRILLYVIGLISLSLGISMMIMYLSLFSLGFSFNEYLEYMFSNYSFYLIPLGILLICLSLFFDNKWNKFIQYRKDRRHL